MQLLVINLERQIERLSFVEAQFSRLGLSPKRVPAVDGRLLDPRVITAFRQRRQVYGSHADLPVSYIAVLQSHIRAWHVAADSDEDTTAIFEDDVHISDRARIFLTRSDWLPAKADLVRLETTRQSMRLSRQAESTVAGCALRPVISGAFGAAGYVVRRDTARWLAALPERHYTMIDYLLFHSSAPMGRALTTYQLDPGVCVQDQFHPDNTKRHRFEMLTQEATGAQAALVSGMKRFLGPFSRRVLGRNRVPFAER